LLRIWFGSCHQFSESSCKIVKEAAYFSGQPSKLMEESYKICPKSFICRIMEIAKFVAFQVKCTA
jgi:hypothetical protein